MGGLRFTDIQPRPTEVLDLTSFTLDVFQCLVPPFEVAFQAPMAQWRLEGRPRTARPVYHVPKLPVTHARGSAVVYPRLPEDLPPPSRAGAAIRDGPEQSPSMASCPLGGAAGDDAHAGDASTRSLAELAKRLGVAEAEATALVVRTRESLTPVAPPAPAPASPLVAMMAPNGASRILRSRLS